MLNKNFKVLIVETDFYARNAINSYLAWDRRTRVTARLQNLDELAVYLQDTIEPEHPDTILLDDQLLNGPEYALAAIKRIRSQCDAEVIVMARHPMELIALAVREAGAAGYVIRDDVGLQVSWMIVWARDYPFIVTPKAALIFPDAAILPDGRIFPALTDRVRQALMLCVIEGMSAELAADEMGLSPHTIRTYIKQGYSIMEATDTLEIPPELSPQEKAFLRLTAINLDEPSTKPNSK